MICDITIHTQEEYIVHDKTSGRINVLLSILCINAILPDERSPFLVKKYNTTTTDLTSVKIITSLDDPDKSKYSECQCRPMNESRSCLVGKNGPERPRNGDGGREI